MRKKIRRHNNIEILYQEACFALRIWGRWSNSDYHSQGYPRASFEQSAVNGFSVSKKGMGARKIPDNEVAEDMEKRLLVLSKRNNTQFTAIKLYFQNCNLSVTDMGRTMKLSRDGARSVLREGVAWIDGSLILN